MKAPRLLLLAVAALTVLAPLPWTTATVGAKPPKDARGGGPDVAVTITDSPDPVLRGGEVTYRMTITNKGADTATRTTFDSVSSFWSLDETVSVTTTHGTCDTSYAQVRCHLGDLAKGVTAEVTYVGRLMGEGDVVRDASAWSAAQEPESSWPDNRAETITTVLRNPDLPVLAQCSREIVTGSASCSAPWRIAESTPVTLRLEPGPTFTGQLTACLAIGGDRSCPTYSPTINAAYVAGQLVAGTPALTVQGHLGGIILVTAGPFRPATARQWCIGGGSLTLGRQVCTPDVTVSPAVGTASGLFGGSLTLAPAG